MIISHQHRFIPIHVLKTGGEAITAALEPELGPRDIVLKGEADMWLRSLRQPGYRELDGLRKHSMARTVRAKLPPGMWRDYFTFSFVRHPVDRVVSLYRSLGMIAERRTRWRPGHAWYYLTRHGRGADPLRWKSMEAFRGTDSFSSFLRHPALGDAKALRTQAEYLSSRKGRLIVDEVGHFETLEQDLRAVAARIGIEPRPPPRVNVSTWQPANGPVEVTDADRDLLLDRFADDLRVFGYGPLAPSTDDGT